MVGFVALTLFATVSPTVTSASGTKNVAVSSPPKGSRLRSAILDTIRRHTNSTEKFIVDRLSVGTKAGSSLAFFSGRPECCEGADYLIKKTGRGPWKVIWSLGRGGGSGDCREFAKSDQRAINTVTNFGLDVRTFAPELLAALAEEQKEAAESNDCVGDSGTG
jgi:hypothetical protein